jgi:nucleoside-diphosphate-sugar epimerase
MAKLIFGCGYLGCRVGQRWLHAGHEVYAVTRAHQRAAELERLGFRPIVADVTERSTLGTLPAAETVLYAVGYDGSSGKAIGDVYARGLANALDSLGAEPARVIYISTTGVYGDAEGEWVDEQTPCRPSREGGRASLAAEEVLRAHRWQPRSIILRLAGLYGPGRIPRRDALVAGEPIPAPAEGYLNLIHVDDAAAVVLAAEERARPPQLYLVSDSQPGQRGDYYRELARLLGAPPPRFVTPPADAPASLRAAADKRISNRRMLEDLGVRLTYPSFREGLAAIVAACR